MGGKCGTCTACCRVFAIPSLDKPAGKWCQHCDIGVGCKIYEQRPPICKDFKCVWLESFDHGKGMAENLRPDRCKVVFSPTTREGLLNAMTMPGMPDAWRKGAAWKFIQRIIKNGGLEVVAGPPLTTTKTLINKYGEKQVQMTEPDENGIQWSIEG